MKNNVISTIPKIQIEIDSTNRRQPTMANLENDYYTWTLNGIEEKDFPKWIWKDVKKPSPKQKKKLIAMQG